MKGRTGGLMQQNGTISKSEYGENLPQEQAGHSEVKRKEMEV